MLVLIFLCVCVWCSFFLFFPDYLLISGTDIILWHGKTGKMVGNVDTNQLKNTMAAISPNGRFIAAAAFTADVKVKTSTMSMSTCGGQ